MRSRVKWCYFGIVKLNNQCMCTMYKMLVYGPNNLFCNKSQEEMGIFSQPDSISQAHEIKILTNILFIVYGTDVLKCTRKFDLKQILKLHLVRSNLHG